MRNLFILIAGIGLSTAVMHADTVEVENNQYIYVNTGTNLSFIPIPTIGVSYLRMVGHHALEASVGFNTLVLVSVPYVTAEYQYHITPDLMDSFFVGVGGQCLIFDKTYTGGRISVGKEWAFNSRRIILSCGLHKISRLYGNDIWKLTPKLEYSIRLGN